MTTAEVGTGRLKYSHTIGLSTMEGRGFYYPVDTLVGKDGKLYTISRSLEGDTRGVRVTIYDIDSEYYGTFASFGEEPGHFIWPVAITQDSRENIYISDEDLNVINVFDTEGSLVTHWGETGSAPGQLDGPAGWRWTAKTGSMSRTSTTTGYRCLRAAARSSRRLARRATAKSSSSCHGVSPSRRMVTCTWRTGAMTVSRS